jgi:two-component system response regulator AtoC
VEQIGWSGVPVLIQGETGSGKEVLARKLHAQSARSQKPFLKLNCAALPSELVESELFGYERGAFTGAFEKKAGIFELADGGTILLDEIGDMDVRLQAKLLQVLQDQEFRRIGGKETVKVNVRILAATHRDLEKAIHERTFREDLYYRLNVIVLQVPPLRERTEDIASLGEFLIRKHADQNGPIPALSVGLKNAMMMYSWPGNVRELENYMRKLVIFQDPDAIARDLQARMSRKPQAPIRTTGSQVANIDRREDMPILEHVTKINKQAETDAILAALDSTRWNRKQAAVLLKIDYKSLLYKMKKLRIDDRPTPHADQPGAPLQRAASGD